MPLHEANVCVITIIIIIIIATVLVWVQIANEAITLGVASVDTGPIRDYNDATTDSSVVCGWTDIPPVSQHNANTLLVDCSGGRLSLIHI